MQLHICVSNNQMISWRYFVCLWPEDCCTVASRCSTLQLSLSKSREFLPINNKKAVLSCEAFRSSRCDMHKHTRKHTSRLYSASSVWDYWEVRCIVVCTSCMNVCHIHSYVYACGAYSLAQWIVAMEACKEMLTGNCEVEYMISVCKYRMSSE